MCRLIVVVLLLTAAMNAQNQVGGGIQQPGAGGGTGGCTSSPCPVEQGGTGAADAPTARTNLGLGSLSTQSTPASGLVGSNGSILGPATSGQITSLLGFTPQNAAIANTNNDAVGAAASALTSAETFASNAANLTSGTIPLGRFPTLNQNTTGTASALTGTPTLCSTGQAPTGILPNGNATGCASIAGGAVSSVFTRTGAVTAQTGDYTVSQITGAAPLASPSFTGTVAVGASPPSLTPGTGGAFGLAEGTAPSAGPASSVDVLYADPTQHAILANFNNGGYFKLSQTIASGTATLGTSAIASGACAAAVTVAAGGIATTDNITADFNGDPTSTTGYAPSAGGRLNIVKYPTSGNVNFKVCNSTAASITPGAATLNWQVVR